jgi:type II secretory ATPase GspE/PulE/Tfp pilus assembly ATPase PilB-like protein
MTVYRKLRDSFTERYLPPTTPIYTADINPLPEDIKEWATWQLDYNPMEEGVKSTLKQIQTNENFDAVPPEWEYWYNNKREGISCTHLGLIDVVTESKLIPLTTLKSLEAVLMFESATLLQIGHVLNWNHANSLDAIAEQCQRNSGRHVQKFQILISDYNKFLEDQINRQMSLGNYLKDDELDTVSFVDEIDPAQFANLETIDQDDTRIKQMAELIIFRAYKIGASDILIEPQGTDFRVRFTVDGYNTIFHTAIPRNYGNSIVAHLKVRASMNITERRVPQDGKITLTIKGKPVELRAATMPVRDATVFQEEKMTMRLLSAVVSFPNLDKIGMKPEHLSLLRKSLSMANGIVIVTGPTGSGKTTTLYASVQELDREKLNVVSLEDPIESYLTGITQTQINEGAGLNFANGLRAILRQAPHVILLGEIRDKEVAHIAVQAANTGHLVLTTLHTNSALGTFSRLQAFGTEPHQIADAVRLIMAQRLIPKICPVCRKARKTTEVEKVRVQKLAGIKLKDQVWQANPAGCRSCNRGFAGRRILTEVVPVDAFIRDILLKTEGTLPLEQIAEHAAKHFQFKPLFTQAIDLVNDGVCDIRDAQRLFLDFGE